MFETLLTKLQKGRYSSATDPQTAASVLLSPGGPLANATTPIFVVTDKAELVSHSSASDEVARGLIAASAFRDALAQALESCLPVQLLVVLGEGSDDERRIECGLHPFESRRAAFVLTRDASLEISLKAALKESRQRYKDLVEVSSDVAWETGRDGRFTFVSPRGAIGYAADWLVGKKPEALMVEDGIILGQSPFATKAPVTDVDVWFRTASGGEACLQVSSVPVLNGRGEWIGTRGVGRDVTQIRQRESSLARAETRKQLIAYISQSIRDEVAPQEMLEAAASAAGRALGGAVCRVYRGAAEALTPCATFGDGEIDPSDAERVLGAIRVGEDPVTVLHSDSCLVGVSTSFRQSINGAVLLYRNSGGEPLLADDRTLMMELAGQLGIAFEQMAQREKLEQLSSTDELTGLCNRRAFFAELESRIARANEKGASGTLLYIDLDNFKLVNDAFGHQRGDEALICVSRLFRESTRPSDVVARLGGDEFAVWLDRADKKAAVAKAKSLLKDVAAFADFSGNPDRPFGFSVGIAVHQAARKESVAELTDRSDSAMYLIKHSRKGGYVVAPEAPTAAGGAAETSSGERKRA